MSISQLDLLHQFKTQVADNGPHACLPRELSLSWLAVVRQSTEALLAGDEENGSISVMAVLALLRGKGVSPERVFENDTLLSSICQDYGIELGLETVHRATECKYEPATLETIFMKRDGDIWREVTTH